MLELLKNVYLLNNQEIKKNIEKLWNRYQAILDNKNAGWGEMNEARAILYFLGDLFVEKIALESLEKRIPFIRPKISIDKFLLIIDSEDKKAQDKYKKDMRFKNLKEFYLIVKEIKNRTNRDNTYLDEKTFNKKYKNLMPKNYF